MNINTLKSVIAELEKLLPAEAKDGGPGSGPHQGGGGKNPLASARSFAATHEGAVKSHTNAEQRHAAFAKGHADAGNADGAQHHHIAEAAHKEAASAHYKAQQAHEAGHPGAREFSKLAEQKSGHASVKTQGANNQAPIL